MATQKFAGTTEFEGAVTFAGGTTQAGALTISSGGIDVTGDSTIDGVLSIGSTPITLTDNTTKLTVDKTIEVAGQVLTTGAVVATYTAETTAQATVADAIYTVAEGVHVVNVSSSGAGGPYAITLGSNNSVNHIVCVYCSAYDTSAFTIASAEGTTTLDAANESATFIYTGSAWRVIGYHGTTGPA